jgi:hypothetical protein
MVQTPKKARLHGRSKTFGFKERRNQGLGNTGQDSAAIVFIKWMVFSEWLNLS